jgi:hypothetical protein
VNEGVIEWEPPLAKKQDCGYGMSCGRRPELISRNLGEVRPFFNTFIHTKMSPDTPGDASRTYKELIEEPEPGPS